MGIARSDQEARDELTLIARDVHLYDGGQTYALDGPGARRIADAILAAGYRKVCPHCGHALSPDCDCVEP